ncbi:MAG: 2-hydroxyglutaryl-CoA dehydratase [Actinobacteria bacterium]|nr:2-hydroxyglutaryl-CoA dehydratase [Actinomycetota bacterium]
MRGFLGVDVGSVSTNLVVIDEYGSVISLIYRRTQGQPISAVQQGLKELQKDLTPDIKIAGVGTTGSARYLSGVIVGADIVKNEITAHAIAASHVAPQVRTVLEIGGQDSKIILLRDGIVVDFAMNTVCAAGTGSFLDHQAARLGIPIEEFGSYALNATVPCQIAGRCSVFAESDMIHKQQMGYRMEDIIYGLCQALVRNYLNNLAKGKDLSSPIVFQGGVAANAGMKRAFEEALQMEIVIPEHYHVMGAIGAALLAKGTVRNGETRFKGFSVSSIDYRTRSFHCKGCENNCEIVKIQVDGKTLACWGGRCGKWEVQNPEEADLLVQASTTSSVM